MKYFLDKNSPIPLYHQLAQVLQDKITRGVFKVGSKLPSEKSLAESFKLNRNTVRHAISTLVQMGLVERHRGIGTIVRRKLPLLPIHQLGQMTSFVDDFDIKDVTFEDTVLSKEIVSASSELAVKLHLDLHDDLVMIERLRFADKTPFVLEKQYYPYEEFSKMLQIEIKGSMYRLLIDEFGADLHHSIQTLRAVIPPQDVAQKLSIARRTACMFLESIAYTSEDLPLEVLLSYYRGDRYLFMVESSRYRRDMTTLQDQ